LTLHASRPWRLPAAAGSVRVLQRESRSCGTPAHAHALARAPIRAGDRRRRSGDDRIRRRQL